MKKMFLVVTILVCMFGLAGIGFTFQNEPEGFRGLKWGDPPTEDIKYLKTIGRQRVYTRKNDKKRLGSAKLELIVYEFYENRLYLVNLLFRGKENYDLLKTICKGRFGEETKKILYDYYWKGPEATVILMWDSFKKVGALGFTSTVIFAEKCKAEKEKEAEKAEGDF